MGERSRRLQLPLWSHFMKSFLPNSSYRSLGKFMKSPTGCRLFEAQLMCVCVHLCVQLCPVISNGSVVNGNRIGSSTVFLFLKCQWDSCQILYGCTFSDVVVLHLASQLLALHLDWYLKCGREWAHGGFYQIILSFQTVLLFPLLRSYCPQRKSNCRQCELPVLLSPVYCLIAPLRYCLYHALTSMTRLALLLLSALFHSWRV